MKLTIDDREVDAPDGATVLEAARRRHIEIPTLCHDPALPPRQSCMLCLVEIDDAPRLLPACATPARAGMVVKTDSERIRVARRQALELLLGDHLGDCIAPCAHAHPAHLDIPGILRLILAGRAKEAGAELRELTAEGDTARSDFSRSETACRRGRVDAPVAIGRLMRYALRASGGETAPPGEAPTTATSPKGKTKTSAPYTVHMGKLAAEELREMVERANAETCLKPADPAAGFTEDEALREAKRCLFCDCRALESCRLRKWAEVYGAQPGKFRGPRRSYRIERAGGVLYAPGKCIACGLCVSLCEQEGAALGLAWIGRGFDVRPGAPLEHALAEALGDLGKRCAAVCPTGALAESLSP